MNKTTATTMISLSCATDELKAFGYFRRLFFRRKHDDLVKVLRDCIIAGSEAIDQLRSRKDRLAHAIAKRSVGSVLDEAYDPRRLVFVMEQDIYLFEGILAVAVNLYRKRAFAS